MKTYNRRRNKLRRIASFIAVIVVIALLICGYFIFINNDSPPSVKIETSSDPEAPSLKNANIAWPTDAYAAIGTVEHGVLASYESEEPRPIASMAKVILALAIMEKQPFKHGESGQTYTFIKKDVENMNNQIADNGSVLPVLIGHELTEYQALQRILIASDNNVADKMARDIFGSEQAYISYANDMLKRMGLEQTVVADPSGLNSGTIGTPSEMVKIGIAALKNPIIAEIVAQKQAELPTIPGGIIYNTNTMLADNGVIGIKTGTTGEAGYCLLFAARYADKDDEQITIVGVVMNSKSDESRFDDSRKLLSSVEQALGIESSQVDDERQQPQRLELSEPT